MKKSNSQTKNNNQSNFSNVPTVANSSSLKSSPLKNLYSPNRERLLSEPKYSNELIFNKRFKHVRNSSNLNDINQSLNLKTRNNGIYITSLGNVSNIKTDLNIINFTTHSSREIENLSKSLKTKNKKINSINKLSLDSLPSIFSSNQNEELIPISPLFSCCEHENSPKLLNRLLFRQKNQELKENSSKAKNEKKIINSKPKKVTVIDGPKNYISKTKEINRIKYCLKQRIESIKDFYYDFRQELKNIDFTMNSIKAYKYNLEHKFINEYVTQLRNLNKITLNERLKEEEQRNEIVRLKKSISNMIYKKKRLELNKFQIEKWLSLQIYIRDLKYINEKNVKEYINKNYKNELIFHNADEFDELYKKKEINNLRLIQIFNIKTEEKAVLYKELKELQNSDDDFLIKSILEKEKLLKLLKFRNNELEKERKEVIKLKNISVISDTKLQSKNIFYSNQKQEKDKKKEKEKALSNNIINYDIIYSLIQRIYDYIILKDRITLDASNEELQYINIMNKKSAKALAQMKIIELAFIYLDYYKMNNMEGNEALYKQLLEEIEQNHKIAKAQKYKKEEEQKLLEMHKKMEAKSNRVVFKPTRQDIYSSLIYIEKIKNEERKKRKKVKKKIDIFDFLYDIEDDNIPNN